MTPEVKLPSAYCSNICTNSMNEICVENCAIKKDMSAFELKKGVELPDLPPFPLDEFIHTMTPRERQNVMAVYMAKTVDFIQGRKEESNDYPQVFSRGSFVDPERGAGDHQGRTGSGVCSPQDGNPIHQDREQVSPGENIRP